MISASDLLPLRCTHDLVEGGIAYALHALPYGFNRAGGSTYDRLRRLVARAAVELAFRRRLSEQGIPFRVKSAIPFTDPRRYDVMLGGRRCEVKSFLISQRDQISQIRCNPDVVLNAPALVASDQHAAEGYSPRDLYLFAFVLGQVTTFRPDLQTAIEIKQPHTLVHVMPEAWNRPSKWIPLGTLVLKSESTEAQTVEIGGQEEAGEIRSFSVELPPRKRLEVQNRFFSLSYLHTKSSCSARMGIYSPVRRETHLISAADWHNLWIYDMELLLAGYSTRDEFSRRASFLPIGSRVFQYNQTQVKNLVVPVSELRPLADFFERAKRSPVTDA
jgi:hypothetical protein